MSSAEQTSINDNICQYNKYNCQPTDNLILALISYYLYTFISNDKISYNSFFLYIFVDSL